MKLKSIFLLLTCVACLWSCNKKDLSDDAYINFAKQLEQAIITGNINEILTAFDTEAFLTAVTSGLELDEAQLNTAREYIQNYWNPAQLKIDNVNSGADFRFIKFYRTDQGEPRAVFRTYFNGSIAIEDFELFHTKDNIKIKDAFAVISGIKWSDDFRQQICNHLNIINEDVNHINKLILVNRAIYEEQLEQADSLLFYLLPSMQNYAYARIMELNLACLQYEYDHVQTLATSFLKDFPQYKSTAAFYLMQSALRNGLVDETNTHIATLISLLGDDPIYYVYSAWAYQNADAYDYALQSLDSAINYLPGMFDLYIDKMDIYYTLHQYDKLTDILYLIDERFYAGQEDVSYFRKRYPSAEKNENFARWIQNRQQNAKI
ncbi:MAG: hypothetical protein J5701_07105 [Bacteroidales bacterium]|nr:hypothetical protein [Bacteroidales bacterium]